MKSTEIQSIIEANGRERVLKQYTKNGNVHRPTSTTVKALEPGIYKVCQDMGGIFFETYEINHDKILRFKDERYEEILFEVNKFWDSTDKYKELGFIPKRGLMLHGQPGTGKSVLINMMMEDVVKQGDVVFLIKDPYTLPAAMEMFNEVEMGKRKALAVIEDIDNYLPYGEPAMLNFMDGDNSGSNMLIVATTNYINHISPRMLREGRFDTKVEIPAPPAAGRKAYLEMKKAAPEEIDQLVEATEGMTFAGLKEFVIGTQILGKSVEDMIMKILGKDMNGLPRMAESLIGRLNESSK